eukprot:g22892.t1
MGMCMSWQIPVTVLQPWYYLVSTLACIAVLVAHALKGSALLLGVFAFILRAASMGAISITWVLTPTAFPTHVRSTAHSILYAAGSLGLGLGVDQHKIYVGNLDKDMPPEKEELARKFKKYGEMVDVWVSRQPPGFAFVTYETYKDALKAIEGMDGVKFQATTLNIQLSMGKGGGFAGLARGAFRFWEMK